MGKKEKQDNFEKQTHECEIDKKEETCQHEDCDCQNECECCEDECECEECTCHDQAENGDGCACGCPPKKDLAAEYLALAQRLQADFDNYRKRVAEQLDRERQEGIKSVIEVFLPCLDAFKEAKKSVSDEKVLTGINMIEEKILSALSTLNVQKIESVGKQFDPHLHNVIAVMKDESKENDIILEEYQSGWTMNDKVLRYSKVVVNKL